MRKVGCLVFGLTLMVAGQAHAQTTTAAPYPSAIILVAPTPPPPLPPDPGPDVTVQQEPLPQACASGSADPWPPPIRVACDSACQKLRCEEHQSKHGSTIASLTVMIKGPPCEKQPKWMRYVVMGVFAAGAILTGVGAVALAEFGAADTVVFNAGEAGGFIR